MPKPYPQEFRDDVVKVAKSRPDGVTLCTIWSCRASTAGIACSCDSQSAVEPTTSVIKNTLVTTPAPPFIAGNQSHRSR